MTDYNRIFLDTAPLIYFLDADIHFGVKMKKILERKKNDYYVYSDL